MIESFQEDLEENEDEEFDLIFSVDKGSAIVPDLCENLKYIFNLTLIYCD